MIHITEEKIDEGSMLIKVDGLLNRKTIDPLSEICRKYIESNFSIILDLEGVTHTDELGRAFLVGVGNEVVFRNLPTFLQMNLV